MIESVGFGEVKIGGKTYYSDVLVWWGGEVEYLPKIHVFDIKAAGRVLRSKPEAVVVGAGMEEKFVIVPADVKALLKDRKVKLFYDVSENAVDIFNGLVAKGKKAVAVIHTTN